MKKDQTRPEHDQAKGKRFASKVSGEDSTQHQTRPAKQVGKSRSVLADLNNDAKTDRR